VSILHSAFFTLHSKGDGVGGDITFRASGFNIWGIHIVAGLGSPYCGLLALPGRDEGTESDTAEAARALRNQLRDGVFTHLQQIL